VRYFCPVRYFLRYPGSWDRSVGSVNAYRNFGFSQSISLHEISPQWYSNAIEKRVTNTRPYKPQRRSHRMVSVYTPEVPLHSALI
jgi:hypothetical protein